MRICSFLPSATEAIYALELQDELYGVTHECDFPEKARSKPLLTQNKLRGKVTSKQIDEAVRDSLGTGEGIYELNYENLERAAPDIIFTQELCEVCAVPFGEIYRASQKLRKRPEIVSLDTFTLPQIMASIRKIGDLCRRKAEATRLVDSLEDRLEKATSLAASTSQQTSTVFFMEWINPIMSCGHWMPELISRAGGKEIFGEHGENSKRVEWEDILKTSPGFLIVAPCGFDTDKAEMESRHLSMLKDWHNLPAVKEKKVFLADGNAYFSRPGPRIVDGLEILASILHPELAGKWGNSYGEKDYRRLNF